MAVSLMNDNLSKYEQAFSVFDKDHDGYLTSEEGAALMLYLQHTPSEAELRNIASSVERAGSGKLDFTAFVALMARVTSESATSVESEEAVREAFGVFAGQDGEISVNELRRVMTSLGETLSEQDVNEMIRTLDVNEDGKVTYAGVLMMARKAISAYKDNSHHTELLKMLHTK